MEYAACRSGQPDGLALRVPVYAQHAAAHTHLNVRREPFALPPHGDRGARARAARQCLAYAALIDAQ